MITLGLAPAEAWWGLRPVAAAARDGSVRPRECVWWIKGHLEADSTAARKEGSNPARGHAAMEAPGHFHHKKEGGRQRKHHPIVPAQQTR